MWRSYLLMHACNMILWLIHACDTTYSCMRHDSFTRLWNASVILVTRLMYIHLCIYIYIHACIYFCIYIYVFVYMYVHVDMYACNYVYIRIIIYIRIDRSQTRHVSCAQNATFTYVSIYTCLSYIYVYIYVYSYILYIYIYICTHIYIYTCIHTYIFITYIHIYIYSRDMPHSHVRPGSFIFGMSHSYVWHNWFMCATWLFYACVPLGRYIWNPHAATSSWITATQHTTTSA